MKAHWILRSIRQQAKSQRRIVISAAVAFCLLALVVGTTRLGVRAVERWGSFVGQNVHVIAYLSDDADPAEVRGLTDLLRRVPSVAGVKEVEPAQALARLRAVSASLGSEPKALDGLGLVIVSTSQGVLSGRKCEELGAGGEVLCSIW